MTAHVDPALVEDRLRDIQSLTDATLSRLDEHDFLTELLDRVKGILQADTAAVLLLDSAARQLIATAAAGLEDEVRQGVRIPVGQGFAGRIAAEQRPVILDRVDHTTVLNPILWEKGIRSMMGVPLVTGGRVIGVLHVGSLTPREFTGADVELLQLAADRAATAVQSIETELTVSRRLRCSAACSPPRCRSSPGRNWPRGTFPAAAGWAGTGMTCLPCRPASWAW